MKESINIGNYERFLIDFMDGTLSKEVHAQVVLFLEQNPNIAEEMDGLIDFNLEIPLDACIDKDRLKMGIPKPIHIHKDNYEEFFIAYAEGDLESSDMLLVEEFIENNPQFEKDFTIYQNLKLEIGVDLPIIDKQSIQRISISANKSITYEELDSLCIAYYEGDLDILATTELTKAVEYSSDVKNIFNNFAKIKILPDTNIVYSNKSALKRRSIIGVVPINQMFAPSVAAAVAMLMIFYVLSPNQNLDSDYAVNYPTEPVYGVVLNSNAQVNKEQSALQNNDTYNIEPNSEAIVSTNKRQNSLVSKVEPKSIKTKSADDIEMTMLNIPIMEPNTSADSGYYMVVAPPDEAVVAEASPKGINKVRQKINRIFKHQTEVLQSETPKESIKNIAQFAMNGFNRMTEGGRSFGAISPSDKDNPEGN